MIIPGIVSVTFRDKTVEEILRVSAACGLQAIEWSENAHVFPGDAEGSVKLREKTEASGLQIAAYGSYFRLLEEETDQAFKQSLLSAKALGAPVIRIWAGNVASKEVSAADRMQLVERANRVVEMAAVEEIKVALEWHRNTLTDENESALRFLDEVDHPNLYCLWQPAIGLPMKERCAGLHELAVRKKLLNLHTYYWKEEERKPLSEGFPEWRQYLAQINRQEDRYALIEFVMDNSTEQLALDASALKQLIAELN
ncbi:hypothetical protein A8709_15485 [Paenibacillus pectinilyticus]|uniref:Xylose isomerase-like TIM barrel domain-containing protein n=1 Tax=Paenibacillus pectinilyticus TaxID=512399 RepID=A0A1C1A4I6_9BACL|nr:TIM barrel protein [Paenibacillus pectinilyticus]OCT15477.1 hypothetical protein A8709_15485 [Paenibacillus pectinilyticus]